jgi:hypothetical protein
MPSIGITSSAEAWTSISKAALNKFEGSDQRHVAEFKDSISPEEALTEIKILLHSQHGFSSIVSIEPAISEVQGFPDLAKSSFGHDVDGSALWGLCHLVLTVSVV